MKKHIVIIEDDFDIRSLMTHLLEEAGYLVTAQPALFTLEELMELQADCFILDENLPFVTGHIICILLKSKPQTRHIPVILVSAADELAGFASLCKADAFLKKPFVRITDLVDLVEIQLNPIISQ